MYLHPVIYKIAKTAIWNYCFLFQTQLLQLPVYTFYERYTYT